MSGKTGKKPDFAETISRMCGSIARLDPGSLARLRRMDPIGPGEAEFWKLAVSHNFRANQSGMMLVKLLAILTPKGPSDEKVLHNSSISLGKLLATGKSDKPLLSETRLLRFIALPFSKRYESLERICRLIANNGHEGVDCVGLARLLFYPDLENTRSLARFYFSNLEDNSSEKEQTT